MVQIIDNRILDRDFFKDVVRTNAFMFYDARVVIKMNDDEAFCIDTAEVVKFEYYDEVEIVDLFITVESP